MKETTMYKAVMITSTGVEVLRISNSRIFLKQYLRSFIQDYIRDAFEFEDFVDFELIKGEDSYTILRKNNDFVVAFKIMSTSGMIASPEELAEEKKERDKTAKNAE